MPTLPITRWSRGQDAKLRAMRERGESFEAISLVLGHTVAACQARASTPRIYKPERQHHKAWTKEQDETLGRMRMQGYGFEAIGIVIGRGAAACCSRACTLRIFKPKAEKPATPTRSAQRVVRERAEQEAWLKSVRAPASENKLRAQLRPCLNCTRTFKSEGPHHRLCSNCRGNTLHRYDTPVMVLR